MSRAADAAILRAIYDWIVHGRDRELGPGQWVRWRVNSVWEHALKAELRGLPVHTRLRLLEAGGLIRPVPASNAWEGKWRLPRKEKDHAQILECHRRERYGDGRVYFVLQVDGAEVSEQGGSGDCLPGRCWTLAKAGIEAVEGAAPTDAWQPSALQLLVLRILCDSRTRMKKMDIAAKMRARPEYRDDLARRAERTLGTELADLKERGHVALPKGPRSGYCLTDSSRALLVQEKS